jgi:hypothetical protein
MNAVAHDPVSKGEVEFNASNAKSDMYLFNAASPGGGKANSTQPSGSTGNFQAFIGFIAIVVGNVAAIITHSDEISQTASKLLGTEWAYRFYLYIVYGACVLFIIGYGSLTYWLYRRFFAQTGRWIKGGFYVAAFGAVGSIVLGSYAFLFRPVDAAPLAKKQLASYAQIVLSQQVTQGEDRGGMLFSQGGMSDDAQVWTTAQCLVALLQQDVAVVKQAGPGIRRAFEYIERSRIKSSSDGWGYLKNINWGVTEIDAWVALSYIYSLRANNAAILYEANGISEAITKTTLVLDILVKRQHTDGGWGPIEKTSNPKHERTYSTIMAIWALAEAEQNGDLVKGHEAEYRAALTSGAKWLLGSYTTSATGFSGWWPNPSARNPVGAYPSLTAQALFVLSKASGVESFIGADLRYKEAVESLIKFAFDGSYALEPLINRRISDNEQAKDSDRYLESRSETAEQSTFLWYPWTIAMAASLKRADLLPEYQQDRLQALLVKLLERTGEENRFARNDEAIYPTVEVLLTEGYYFSGEGLAGNQR